MNNDRKDLVKDKLIELGFEAIITDGNCEAMQKILNNGVEILVCAFEHSVDFINCKEICIGIYSDFGEFEEEICVNNLEELLSVIQR